jgi:hypothetical protein
MREERMRKQKIEKMTKRKKLGARQIRKRLEKEEKELQKHKKKKKGGVKSMKKSWLEF